MNYRVFQARISVVTTCKIGEGSSGDPAFRLHGWNVGPGERFIGNGLVCPSTRSVLCALVPRKLLRSADLANVDAAPGVHQPAPSIHDETQAQRVGVSVSGAAHALRTGIDDNRLRVRIGIGQDVKAAVGKGSRTERADVSWGERVFESASTAGFPNSQIASSVNCARGTGANRSSRLRPGVGHVLGPVARGFHRRRRHRRRSLRPACLREGGDDVEHSLEHGVVGWGDFESIARLEQARIEEEVERVDVVIERLLEVHSIGRTWRCASCSTIFQADSLQRARFGFGIQSSEKSRATASPNRCVFGEK